MNMSQAVETIETEVEPSPERDYLLDFIRNIRFGSNGRQNDAPRVCEGRAARQRPRDG